MFNNIYIFEVHDVTTMAVRVILRKRHAVRRCAFVLQRAFLATLLISKPPCGRAYLFVGIVRVHSVRI